ncbi:GNAT family N-acetyltransferase [Pseudolysinimonas kribbensis]|nr:GNAT family N-acetyltransferase [Pseudolysinimonas kribbensis]
MERRRDAGPAGSVLIRRADAGDVPAIARFQRTAWQEAYAGILSASYLSSLSVPAIELEWEAYLESGSRSIAMAHDAEGRLLGVASWGPADVPAERLPPLELKSIYVDAAHFGRGVGGALLKNALGDRPAQLWMFEGNERAAAFYRRHGFSPDDGRLHDAAADAWEVRLVRWG